MTDEITWPELITLMVHGPDRTMRGRIRHDDGEDHHYIAYATGDDDPEPVFARGDDHVVVAWLDGARLRLEDADGRPTLICDGESAWGFDEPGGPPRESRIEHVVYGFGGTDLLHRGDVDRWRGTDFTRPTGPPTPTTFLDRDAWLVELAPPSHKPHPMQVVIDAETGMLLQLRNDAFRSVTEWTELAVGESLDPALFTWDGPVVTWEQQVETRRREQEAHDRDRVRRVVDVFGTVTARLEVDLTIDLNELEADGSMYVSIHPIGSAERRPRSDEPWRESRDDDPVYWGDDRWQWRLVTWGDEAHLAPGGLESLQALLARADDFVPGTGSDPA